MGLKLTRLGCLRLRLRLNVMIIGSRNESLYHHHSTKDQWNKKIKTWNHFCMLSLEHFQPRWFVLFLFLIKLFIEFIILIFSSSQNLVVFVLWYVNFRFPQFDFVYIKQCMLLAKSCMHLDFVFSMFYI
jgi:hypothetical protein